MLGRERERARALPMFRFTLVGIDGVRAFDRTWKQNSLQLCTSSTALCFAAHVFASNGKVRWCGLSIYWGAYVCTAKRTKRTTRPKYKQNEREICNLKSNNLHNNRAAKHRRVQSENATKRGHTNRTHTHINASALAMLASKSLLQNTHITPIDDLFAHNIVDFNDTHLIVLVRDFGFLYLIWLLQCL